MAKVKAGANKTELKKHSQDELEDRLRQIDKDVQGLKDEARRITSVLDVKLEKAREEVLAASGDDDQEVNP